MRILSKSKLLSFRQCHKRLWLEIHRSELRQDSASTRASFDTGNQVGDVARDLYDPQGLGQLIDPQAEGFKSALARSMALIRSSQPIFEAGFSAAGGLAFADVMLPVQSGDQLAWKMVEVKSSTSVKDYHRDDVAIQAFVARKAGVPLVSIALAYIDSSWIYLGNGDYSGLLVEEDLTVEAFDRDADVLSWISTAQAVCGNPIEPAIGTGRHCAIPFECGFLAHCQSQERQAEFPVHWLPRIQSKALKTLIEIDGIKDLRDIPDDLLNDQQLRVKTHTLSGTCFFDAHGAAADLSVHGLPGYFLDFETIQFAIPIWPGTRPYQQTPFQFSLHVLAADGGIEHREFLDLSGDEPTVEFAKSLVSACGTRGPVFVYNAGFETARIKELAARLPALSSSLLAINDRVVDLLTVAQQRYYHPSQKGSWSIKKVLPAVAPDLSYDDLHGIQDGSMAMNGFLEAIAPTTAMARRVELKEQLSEYCFLDTFAMVRLWCFFAGREDLLK